MNDVANRNSILNKRRGLGRGLDALFEDTEVRAAAPVATGQGVLPGGAVMMSIAQLVPGKYQPRKTFDDQTLHQLAQSIAQHGVIQPLLVRPLPGHPGTYEIIAGERRWRAAQKAQRHEVPVVINTELDDAEALQMALIENLQREDLNAIDEALGYRRLMDEFSFSPERMGDLIGKSRSHIANTLRLLNLPSSVRDMVTAGDLSAGHARALLGAENPTDLAQAVVKDGLSVRAVEKLVAEQSRSAGNKPGRATRAMPEKDVNLLALEKDLTDALGLKVLIEMAGMGAGAISLSFKSLDQLDSIIKRLRQNPH